MTNFGEFFQIINECIQDKEHYFERWLFFLGSNAYQYRHRADAVGFGTGTGRRSAANGRIEDTAGSGEYAELGEQVGEVGFFELLLQAQYTNADRYVVLF